MTYTRQLKELLNELKLAKGKNCLIFAISEQPARLKELIASGGFEFEVQEIYLKGRENLLEMLLEWKESSENTTYFVHGIGNQFPWVLPYVNLHRDLFFDIKRPVVVVGSEYEIMEIQKHAPDWFRFRSRTYELKEGELGEESVIMRLAEPAESEPVYYSLPVFEEEESEEEIKERLKIDEYLLSSERDDYKRAELYMSLSLSYFKLGNFEHGEGYLRKSQGIREKLKDNKGIILNYARLSAIFIGKGEFEKAIDACNEALIINPDLEGFYYIRGLAYSKLKQHERAIEDYSKAIELDPDDVKAYNNRGNAYYELKQHERAIEDYSKTIELNPNDAEAYNNRGNAYSGLNQYERAIEDYDKVIELDPNFAEAYGNRGIVYSEMRRYEESARELKNAGILFLNSGREEDAAKAFSFCFDLQEGVKGEDVIYSGIALFLVTKDAKIRDELRGMRIQDETMRTIFELALKKLRGEDISDGIAVIEGKEKREEMKILFELLKRF